MVIISLNYFKNYFIELFFIMLFKEEVNQFKNLSSSFKNEPILLIWSGETKA
jgi:hypothetical protein